MNLGFDVRGGLEKLPSALEAMIARINTIWKKEHNIDGTHSDVTVSGGLNVSGAIVAGDGLTVTDDVAVGGDVNVNGDLIVDGVPITGVLAAHAPTHDTGGSDPITALNGAVITTGTVADARLSSNVALKNIDNNFSAGQTVDGGVTATGVIHTLNNVHADGAIVAGNLLYANVGIVEYARPFLMGSWPDVPFNAAHYSATGGGTWTVGAAAVIKNRYTLIGKTMIWEFYISWFSGSNTVAGTVTGLNIAYPGGFTSSSAVIFRRHYGVAGAAVDIDITTGVASIAIVRTDGTAWTGTTPGLITSLTLSIN